MNQRICSEELLSHVFFRANLACEMAPGSRPYCKPYQNFPLDNLGNNKLANSLTRASTESNNSPASIFDAFTLGLIYIITLTCALIHTLTSTLLWVGILAKISRGSQKYK